MAAKEQDSEAQSFIYFIAVMTVVEQDSEVLGFMYMYLIAVNSIVLNKIFEQAIEVELIIVE